MQTTRDLALVTGASSGIGAEIARELAARQVDLVLTARRKQRLEALAEELAAAHGVQVTIIPHDLGAPDGAQQLFEEVQRRGLHISILINNAGFGKYRPVVQQPLDDIHGMIQLNLVAATTLARLFAAEMSERGHGYVLNVASFGAFQPVARLAVYSATKAYLLSFSQTLQYELRRSGIKVSALCPGFTATEFNQVAEWGKSSFMRLAMLDVRLVARAGVAGMFKGKTVIVPGAGYKLMAIMLRFQPRWLSTALGAWVGRSPAKDRRKG